MPLPLQAIATALGQEAPEPDSTTAKQWELWISDAEMLIENRRADLNTPPPDAAKLDYVVREAVVTHIRHPDDATQVTIAVDDASTSRSYRSGRGRVTILDEWWTLLGLTAPTGAYSIDTAPRPAPHDPVLAFITATDSTW